MRVLVLNSGSSSLKFRILEILQAERAGQDGMGQTILAGSITGIGGQATLSLTSDTSGGGPSGSQGERVVANHEQAVQWTFEFLSKRLGNGAVEAVGHRVVHGGERFREPVRIDAPVLVEIERLNELAPLHNPACLAGIHGAQAVLGPRMPMVAVFDTTFHRSMPDHASTYAIAHDVADRHRIQRYGFHGIAHSSAVASYAACTGRSREQVCLITLHLGNGCSATAVRNGRSIDTSMGFTPLEGLVMGTRSGDVDPAIVSFLAGRKGMSPAAVERMLNEQSGLSGVSGLSHDMAALLSAEQRNHPRAKLAIEIFCYRVRKYIGAYLAALGGAEAVTFSGGIGEHAPTVRARICRDMEWCGLQLDPERNAVVVGPTAGTAARISRDGAGLAVYVVAVDEESEIARETVRCLGSYPSGVVPTERRGRER